MSPLPLSTSIETFQGGGRAEPWSCAADGAVAAAAPDREHERGRDEDRGAAPAASQRPTGRRAGGSTGIPESRRASRWSIPSEVA